MIDLFTNTSGDKLINLAFFPNPSTQLGEALTSNRLYFESGIAKNFTETKDFPRLHAPSTYSAGSSIAHLHSISHSGSLMTPALDRGVSIRYPDEAALSVLWEMGWINTRLEHKPIADTENIEITTARLALKAISDNGLKTDSIFVYYAADSIQLARDTLALALEGEQYLATIPISPLKTNAYYFTAVDSFNRVFRLPSVENTYFSFFVGPDTIPPTITHIPPSLLLQSDDSLKLAAIVRDKIGVDSVFIYIGTDKELLEKYPLVAKEIVNGEQYQIGFAIGTDISITAGDTVYYKFVARDKSSAGNEGILPEVGFFKLFVDGIGEALASYSNDFNDSTAGNDFLGTSFSIRSESGFSSPALHSEHPYQNSPENIGTIDYIIRLKTPIIVSEENPAMSFDEIALIEPGEDGSVFGGDNFFDYVVVEGSKDEGTTWLPLEDGYDARADASWLAHYNGSIEEQNSKATGRESLYKNRIIRFPSNTFQKDDVMHIRFRLRADPFAYGWGWVIDNLEIQTDKTTVITALTDYQPRVDEFAVYPNPSTQKCYIQTHMKEPGELYLQIFNTSGSMMLTKHFQLKGQNDLLTLDVNDLKIGIYFIKLYTPKIQITKKLVIVKN